jgi:hypothetical protein
MYSELPFNQCVDEDLAEHFADYTIVNLRSNLLKLIQINVVYSYCESSIVEQLDSTEEEIATILNCCREKDWTLLQTQLPFSVLLDLRKVKHEVHQSDWGRQQIIGLILSLIVENTLLYSSLAKFAYS